MSESARAVQDIEAERNVSARRFVFEFVLMLGLIASPATSWAQPAGRVPRIGVIGDQSPTEPRIEAFRQGLRELGYIDGQNIAIEYRYAYGDMRRFPELVTELLRLKVDVLLVGGTSTVQTAMAQTSTVPIVFALAADPVPNGLVTSLARPGANATGLSILLAELTAKQLERLKAAAPRVSRVAVLYNPLGGPASILAVERAREAARVLALELQVLEVRHRNEIAGAFEAMKARRAGAVLIISQAMFGNELVELARLATVHRLPAIYNRREFAEAGGLLAYGPNFSDNYRRAAGYVDKILKGAKPADLPVEQPMRFDMVVNLRTAKAIGLTIPPSILLLATEVIE